MKVMRFSVRPFYFLIALIKPLRLGPLQPPFKWLYRKLVLIAWCCILFFCSAKGQQNRADSLQLNRIDSNLTTWFSKAIGNRLLLYSGPAYEGYDFRSKTNANFNDTTGFVTGRVNYNGVFYDSVPLLYDLNKGLLISRLYNSSTAYSFLSEHVTEFYIMGHHFKRVIPDSTEKHMNIGFYDELYHTIKLQFIARRIKTIQQETTLFGINNVFQPKVIYYLKKGDVYHEVNSKSDILNVLIDKRRELRQYLNAHRIRFEDNKEQNMVLLIAYYDHITG